MQYFLFLPLKATIMQIWTLKKRRWVFYTLKNKFWHILFQETIDSILCQVYEKFIARNRHNLQINSKIGLNKICWHKKFAFVTSELIATYVKNKLSCSIVPLPEALNREYLSLALQKTSLYLEILNQK